MGGPIRVPLVVWQACVLLLSSVWPLSFAYAVAKHRVLDVPVLLKRSARYVLVQRGYLTLLFAAATTAIALFTHTIFTVFAARDQYRYRLERHLWDRAGLGVGTDGETGNGAN
jgi:hypothetical protein